MYNALVGILAALKGTKLPIRPLEYFFGDNLPNLNKHTIINKLLTKLKLLTILGHYNKSLKCLYYS